MLKSQLLSLELGPEIRAHIEPPIFDALFSHVAKHPPAKHKRGVPSLTVSRAKQILEIVLPHYRERVAASLDGINRNNFVSFKEVGLLTHQWIHESVKFFRREGAPILREALVKDNEEQRVDYLWSILFSRRLLPLIQGSGLLRDPQKFECCDLAVECIKLWLGDIAKKFGNVGADRFSPSAFFLDTENYMEGEIEWKGRRLHLRGKPDAVMLNGETGRPEVWEYKFGLQGQIELQIAQVLFYLHLLNAVKGQAFETGRLEIFRVTPDLEEESSGTQSEFAEKIEAAFAGYVGNYAAVRRLKIECTLALKQSTPPTMPINLMFSGPGGLGKTELARRVAKALGLPLVDVPATTVRDVDSLLERINQTLHKDGQEPLEVGTDSGLKKLEYPPLVIFLDEVHELRRNADSFLNMFEPKEKRAVGKKVVGDFKNATLLAATTTPGLLPSPFLSRFRIIDLVPYTAEEVAAIIKPVFQKSGKSVEESFLVGLAKRGRLNPRVAIQRAEEMLSHHLFDEKQYPLNEMGLERISTESWRVDTHGLRQLDHTYLKALQSGPRGLSALVSLLPVEREEITQMIEPYLLQLEAISLTTKGRELTERGRLILEG